LGNKFIITVDGPAGSGKSTLAKALAKKLGYVYIDTGAMYREIAWKALEEGLDIEDENAISDMAERCHLSFKQEDLENRISLNGTDITRLIRNDAVSDATSKISRYSRIREKLVSQQREIGKEGGIVIEGRDTGTVVFPKGDIKFFLKAEAEERGRRRFLELKDSAKCDLKMIIDNIRERDKRDEGRTLSPLTPAKDAILIDTTDKSVDELLDFMVKVVESRCR
ncbi:MAG: (d)CMP kinase, partial [Nitrospinae bacterium]|nr:(d)CMP kinase [Nitrospinota bacterium]